MFLANAYIVSSFTFLFDSMSAVFPHQNKVSVTEETTAGLSG